MSQPGSRSEAHSTSTPVSGGPDSDAEEVTGGAGLCLSGGGYRAMVFHLGSLWRLNELGMLPRLSRISSVSGGSITSAMLALRWKTLQFDGQGRAANLREQVIDPVRRLARRTIDVSAVVLGALLPGTVSQQVIQAYRKHLFGDATLQDLPDAPAPRFVFNATNIQSGALWRFSRPYMADWRVGMVERPRLPLAVAVAASSAFPPVLSPVVLQLEPEDFEPGSGDGLQRVPYTSEVVLADGGVYDNLGLETCWKQCTTLLVSDAGGELEPEDAPARDWVRHGTRVIGIIDSQVRRLRKRQLIGAFESGQKEGTYWGIRTDIQDYGLPSALPAPHARTLELARLPTRLAAMDDTLQERLINWGYAVCDAAMRKHVSGVSGAAPALPFAQAGI